MAVVGALGFALRGGSAAAKFLFVLYLAGTVSATLLGQVALLLTITAVFTQVAGLEINQVIGRQLHALTADDRVRMLQLQAFAVLTVYVALVPALLYIYADLLAGYWISACGILVLEHFITEVYRLNILMLRPVYASGLLFIKNAGWIICFVALVEVGWAEPSLALVLNCWFAVVALTAAPTLLNRHVWPTLIQFLTPSAWVRPTASMVWQARLFIVASVAMAGIGSMDKLLINEQFSAADLGVYYFFATCASVMSLVVSFSIGATAGPRCIKVFSTEGRSAYLTQYKRLKRLYWLTAAATTAALVLPADVLLTLFDKADYRRNIAILYLLVPSTALVVLCEPYKMNAYLERRDLSLLLGQLFHLLCVAVCLALFMLIGGLVWVAAGVLLSSALTYLFFSLDVAERMIRRLRPMSA